MLNFKFIILPLSGLILFISIYITIIIQLKNFDEVKNYDLYSSVYCNFVNDNQINQTTNNQQSTYQRRCKFRNLCYKVNSQEFIFILNKDKSLLINLPINRFKPSLQYLGSIEHNNFYFNYIEIDYLDYKQLFADKKIVLIKDLTLIYSRFKPDNLMHLIHDDLLPIYNTLKSIFFNSNYDKKSKRLNFFIFDDYNHVGSDYYSKLFYSILFKNVNIFYKNDFKADDQLICFENIEVGLDKLTSFYDYGFKYYQKPIDKTDYEKLLIQLYTKEIKDLIFKDALESFLDLNFGKDPFKCDQENYVVLLSRTRSRLILNEDQVLNQLKDKFNDFKIIKIDLENWIESLDNLIRILSCTKLMIGMHGAGLILSIFLPKQSNLIELFPYKIKANYYRPYKQLANVYELNYFSWSNTNSSNNFYNFKYLKEEIKDKIYNDEDVEQSLCCDESYFLFRIYQDTIVDKEELDQLLSKTSIVKDQFKQKLKDQLIDQQMFKITPSNLKLECSREDKIINLKWTRPWNIIKNANNLEYEIIINIPDDNISNMYNLKDTNLVIDLNNLKDVNSKLYIWIRAKLDNLNGPFNDKQFIC